MTLPPADPGQWADLRVRVLSALVMVLGAGAAIVLGDMVFMALVLVLVGLMVWELARMLAPSNPHLAIFSGAGAVVALAAAIFVSPLAGIVLALGYIGVFCVKSKRYPVVFAFYSLAILCASWALVALRLEVLLGFVLVAYVLTIVVVTDIAGYFAGRLIGGPKFWPRISPKKTWAGIVAGWIASACVGVVIAVMLASEAPFNLIASAVVLSFASQLGDIVESAIKRLVGVKDSSDLIPGHGGVLDRLDGVLGAALLVFLAKLIFDPSWEALV